MTPWHVYWLRCRDGSFYIGITTLSRPIGLRPLAILLVGILTGCSGGARPGPGRGPDGPALGVTVYLDPGNGHPTYDGQIALCREQGIAAARVEGRLSAPGEIAAVLGPTRPLLDRLDTVLLAFDPAYARAHWPEAEPALRQDLKALDSWLEGSRARVIIALGGGRAGDDEKIEDGIRGALAGVRAPGRVTAWEIDVPVGPEDRPGEAADDPQAPAWRRPWSVYAAALSAAARSDVDAVAIRYFPNWEAAPGRRPVPLDAYVSSLRGILRHVRAQGKPACVSEFGMASRDLRFAPRNDVIAAVVRLAREERVLGAFYYSLLGPDFGLWDGRNWRVQWREVTGIR